MSKYFWILLLGGCGALTRSSLGATVQGWAGGPFPWGTALVNVLGCCLFGLVWSLGERNVLLSPETKALVLTGFMGAFTTFSTYAFETTRLLQAGSYGLAAANLVGQNLLGILGILLGLWLGGGGGR